MSGHTRHPDTEELADFLAGLASGTRAERLAGHVAQCRECASLSDQIGAVSAELAAVPVPALPHLVERRITVAIRTETAARDAQARGARHAMDRQPKREPSRRARLWSRRVPVLSRALSVPLGVLVPAVVVLALAVGGYALSFSASSQDHPAAEGVPRTSAATGASVGGVGVAGERGTVPGTHAGTTAAFVVTASGTDYRAATLQTQVQQELQVQSSAPRVTPTPAGAGYGAQGLIPASESAGGRVWASRSARGGGDDSTPSSSLVGCVMRLTDDQEPAMVDRAVYESRPAYVIAVSDRAWVVPRDCTADHPSVITSVALSPAA